MGRATIKASAMAAAGLLAAAACQQAEDPPGEATYSAGDGGTGGGRTGVGACGEPQSAPPFPLSSCGDGVVDLGEECDGGGEHSPACSSDCTFSRCGDGFVNSTTECCEHGNAISPCSPANLQCLCC